MIKIAMADDHVLLRNALAGLIDNFGDCKVIILADNGKDLINKIQKDHMPDIVLLDLNMPEMEGYETAQWLNTNFPQIHVLMLTMYDAEATMIRLLQAGVKGFLKKDIHPTELKQAIISVKENGYYYSNTTTGKLVNLFRSGNVSLLQKNLLTPQEVDFLKLSSSDYTYKEIATHLGLNPRTVDNLRDHLFEKLDVKSRVGLAMFAIKHGLVRV